MTQYETNIGSVSDNDTTPIRIRRLYLRDNLEALREMEEKVVALVYLDPPFNTNRTYKIVFRGPDLLRPTALLPMFKERDGVWTFN